MRVLFITGHKYLPQMRGGMQWSTHELCRNLRARGHHVAVLAGLLADGWFALKTRLRMQINLRRRGQKIARDTAMGYPVWYSWFPWESVAHVAAAEKPDVIVISTFMQARMAPAAAATGIPFLFHFLDAEASQIGGSLEAFKNRPSIANSDFTAAHYRTVYGFNPTVIYPLIDAAKYKTTPRGDNVTFINPHEKKGLPLALNIARACPEIPFAFVEGWPLEPAARTALTSELAALPNVTLVPPQKNMRTVYGHCRVLLAPSQWEEAYGRVATEAQISGIPVLASARGGLPEAVGDGGVILSLDTPVEEWAATLRRLWNDRAYHDELSAKALRHAARPDIHMPAQIDKWEECLRVTMARG